MGKSQGKNAWRKSKSAAVTQEALQKISQDSNKMTVSELPNDSLFFIDTKTQRPTRAAKKLAARNGELRSLTILQDDPKVRRLKGGTLGQKSTEQKRVKQLAVKAAAKLASPPPAERPSKRMRRPESYNLWDAGADEIEEFQRTTAEKELMGSVPGAGSNARRLVAKKKPLGAHKAAIEVADAGASYNPTYVQHQDLLAKAVSKEVRSLDQEADLDEKLRGFKAADAEAIMLDAENDVAFDETDDDEEEEEAAAEEAGEGKKAKANKVKSQAQRNRDVRRAEMEKQLAEKRAQKKLTKQLSNVGSIAKEVAGELKRRELRADLKRTRLEEAHKTATPRVGKYKFEDSDEAVLLTEEIPRNLRTLTKQGSLLKDRFKSLQRRNIIEPRKVVKPRRRYPLKFTEKINN